MTANDACCACGGGTAYPATEEPTSDYEIIPFGTYCFSDSNEFASLQFTNEEGDSFYGSDADVILENHVVDYGYGQECEFSSFNWVSYVDWNTLSVVLTYPCIHL